MLRLGFAEASGTVTDGMIDVRTPEVSTLFY